MSVLIFFIILIVLVISHEFGHFIIAKKSDIRVDEFAFGFPPRIASVKKGETTYSFNALPVGGYVKIFGENPDEESISGPQSARSFVNKPKRVQAFVLLGGVLMNFLLAWILISVSFMAGLPASVGSYGGGVVEDAKVTIVHVDPNSPAELAGLLPGDKILKMKSGDLVSDIPSIESVQYFIAKYGADEITLSYERSGKEFETILQAKEDTIDKEKLAIGVSLDTIGVLKQPFHRALISGFVLTAELTKATAVGLGTLIVNGLTGTADMSTLAGPVGIVGIVGDAASFGFSYLLSLTAIISINLVIINLIPFPALDGGRLLFLVIEKIKGSRIPPKVSNIVNAVGFGILMLLMAVITYHDIVKIIK